MLDLYEEPYDRDKPVVCFDERPCQLIGDVIRASTAKAGPTRQVRLTLQQGRHLSRFDELRATHGLAAGAGHEASQEAGEFAHSMRHLAEAVYPQAEKIRVVLDNLSTHTASAFYESFPAEQARRLARRIESATPRCTDRGLTWWR